MIESHESPTPPCSKPLRWGLLGASRIARKAVVPAIRAEQGELVAVAAGARARAEAFAREFDIPIALEGYQALLEREDVDAVYLSLANGLHDHWALACARAVKHCLCEKPLVTTANEARELHDAFAQVECRLMEAFMWRHHSQVAWTMEKLLEAEIGHLRRIHGKFSYTLDRPGDYRWRDDQGGGSLWDVGCYPINAMRMFFDRQPIAVSARASAREPGSRTDCSTVGWLDFGQDQMGLFESSFTSAFSHELTLVGTEGTIRLERPFSTLGRAARVRIEIGEREETRDFEPEDAYGKMIAHFTRAVRDPSFALMPGEEGVEQAVVMEALAASAAEGGAPRILTNF